MMPRVDGFEFLARRSRDQRLAAVPVIVCSAISDLSGFRIGGDASAWLPKPVNVQALLHQARIWSRTDRPQ
jgi:CheY-like chemotaxis protein